MSEKQKRTILYGTGNPGKLASMRQGLASLPLEIVGLADLRAEQPDLVIPEVPETGSSVLENATLKAKAYYEAFHMPVFSCDSGLYLEGLPEELQPGIHVRTVNGKYLSDAEMTEYYAGLAREYGDIKARYRNGICLVLDEEHIYTSMDESLATEYFLITSVPHPKAQPGFPLDRLSLDIATGEYYYDLEERGARPDKSAVEEGFLHFFQHILKLAEELHQPVSIIPLTDRISYIPASSEPLSADVGIIRGDRFTWLFDVGCSEEVAAALNSLPENWPEAKNIVLSHFHPDHMVNWAKVVHEELYQGANTWGYTHEGIAIGPEDPAGMTLWDGLELLLFPIPSCHAKGSLGLAVGDYAFLGDATYSTMKKGRIVYNAQLLREQIQVLRALPVRYFLLSHRKEFCRKKEQVLEELEAIYARRQKDDPYIPVE